LVLLLVVLTGCTSEAARLAQFNDQIATSNKRLARAAIEFRDAFAPLTANPSSPADPDKVKSAYDNLRSVLNEIKEERKTVDVPSNSAAADLHKAYDAYLQAQEQLVAQEFTVILRLVQSPGLSPRDKGNKISDLQTTISQKGRDESQKLTEVHRKFSEAVRMKLVPAY
jgi:hypothetical protein